MSAALAKADAKRILAELRGLRARFHELLAGCEQTDGERRKERLASTALDLAEAVVIELGLGLETTDIRDRIWEGKITQAMILHREYKAERLVEADGAEEF